MTRGALDYLLDRGDPPFDLPDPTVLVHLTGKEISGSREQPDADNSPKRQQPQQESVQPGMCPQVIHFRTVKTVNANTTAALIVPNAAA